jgi:hypothetical protein
MQDGSYSKARDDFPQPFQRKGVDNGRLNYAVNNLLGIQLLPDIPSC